MDLVHELCPLQLLEVTKKRDTWAGWLASIQHLAHIHTSYMYVTTLYVSYIIHWSPCSPRCVRCGRWGPRPCPPSRSRSPSSTGTGAPSLEWLELWNKSDNNKINAKEENLIVKVWDPLWHCDNIPAAANLFYYNPIWNKISTLISSYFSFHFRRGCLGSIRWT